MSQQTSIEWTDSTWNPIRGCSRVSEGCRFCYAEKLAARFSDDGQPFHLFADRNKSGSKWTGTVEIVEKHLYDPLGWKKPRKIFVNSMSDLFHERLLFREIALVIGVLREAHWHTFQVLTKRAERMLEFAIWWTKQTKYPLPDNLWLGVSVENQGAADERIPLLLQTRAAKRFVSAEPLLGPIDLTSVCWPNKGGHRVDVLRRGYWNAKGYIHSAPSAELGAERGYFTNHSDMAGIDWVICGGESGPEARPIAPDWVRSMRDQCSDTGVPFFFKQWGEYAPESTSHGTYMVHLGKKAAGAMLDGRYHKEFPGSA